MSCLWYVVFCVFFGLWFVVCGFWVLAPRISCLYAHIHNTLQVDLLAAHGVQYLNVGVNDFSVVPAVEGDVRVFRTTNERECSGSVK